MTRPRVELSVPGTVEVLRVTERYRAALAQIAKNPCYPAPRPGDIARAALQGVYRENV